MSSNIDKIEALESKLNKSLKKANSTLIITTIIFIILVIFVIGYTSYIFTTVKNLATPENIAAYISGSVQEKIPAITANINDNSKAYADLMATETVSYARSLLPLAEDLSKEQISLAADKVNSDLNAKYLPILNQYFSVNKEEILNAFGNLSDEEVAQQLTGMMLYSLDSNIALMQEPFNEAVASLQERIDKLAYMPDSELTKQEIAEKNAIAYWIYLVDHQEQMSPAW